METFLGNALRWLEVDGTRRLQVCSFDVKRDFWGNIISVHEHWEDVKTVIQVCSEDGVPLFKDDGNPLTHKDIPENLALR